MIEKYPVVNGYKTCSKCLDNKPTSEFYKNKSKNGYRSKCTSCVLEENKIQKEIYRARPETQIKIKVYRKKYYKENIKTIKEKRILNRKAFNKTVAKWHNKKYREDPAYNVEHRFRTRLQKLCRSLNYAKKDRTSSYLGCSKLEFKQHIESLFRDGMTWDNKNLWVLDHIKPCCAYNLTNEDELKECFNFKNIQPLWYFENEQKIKTDILWKLQKQK